VNFVAWETEAIPADGTDPQVTLDFAGGLGFASQPKSGGFVLRINEATEIPFDVETKSTSWES
jgi:hypothetical protein